MNRDTVLHKAWPILVAIPVLAYLWGLYAYSNPLPYCDDIDAILGFLNQYTETTGFGNRLELIFSQHNEHRLAYNRSITALYYSLFGQVDLRVLTFIGNLPWFALIGLLWVAARRRGVSAAEFSVVPLLLLSLTHHELITWAMASMQQYAQLFFAILALYLFVREAHGLALLCLAVASFSGGGGLLVAPLLVLHACLERRFRLAAVVVAFAGTLAFAYFVYFPYAKPVHHPSIVTAMLSPHILAGYIPAFLGSVSRNIRIAIPLGLILLALSVHFIRRHDKADRFLILVVLFVLETAFVTALTRSGFGIQQALSSRYSEYSLILMSLLYLLGLSHAGSDTVRTRRMQAGVAVAVLTFAFSFAPAQRDMRKRSDDLTKGVITHPDQAAARAIIERAQQKGIFVPR